MKNCIFLVCFLIVAATCGGLERVGEVVAVEGVLKAVDSSRVERSLLEVVELKTLSSGERQPTLSDGI